MLKNINFKITEDEIREYLKNYKKLVFHKEALFVQYMKENKEISIEVLEMLIGKYNFCPISFQDESFPYMEENPDLSYLPNFQDFLHSQKLDAKGLCNILIPSLGLCQEEKRFSHSKTNIGAYEIAQELGIEDAEQIDVQGNLLNDIIENFVIAGQIKDFGSIYKGYSDIAMGREKCRQILLTDEDIYGKDNVRTVRKLVKEREWCKHV